MEQQQQPQQPLQSLPTAPFPAPPPFWKHFTAANVERLKELEATGAPISSQLPLELAILRPPPPPAPAANEYFTFNSANSLSPDPVLPPVEELLFDPHNPNLRHAVLLSKITKSLLLNFLELTTVLGNDPTEWEEKMADIRKLTLNGHVAINMYRPHQARENVREMLQGALEDAEREIERLDDVKERVEAFLKEVEDGQGKDDDADTNGNVLDQKADSEEVKKSQATWNMMDEDVDN